MKYETKELTYYSGFSLEIVLKRGILLAEECSSFYTAVFSRGCRIAVNCRDVFLSGILLFSPCHGVKKIEVLENPEGSALMSVVFSPRGINSSFERFPDNFEYSALTELESGYKFFCPNPSVLEVFENCFENMDRELNCVQSQYWPCLSKSYLMEIILLLKRNSLLQNEVVKSESRIEKILEYIQCSFYKHVTLEGLSEMFATNRTTLNAMFNKNFGTSVMSYVNNLRIQNAALLLSNTGLPICDIAVKSGFSDESYFSKAFKKQIGKSPRAYRLSCPPPYGNVGK